MKKIFNIYWKDTDNIGDVMSGAEWYFNFPLPVESIDIKSIHTRLYDLKDNFIILGGGGHIHLPSIDYNNGHMQHLEDLMNLSKHIVVWGLGNNIHGTKEHVHPDCLKKALLVGLRDTNSPYDCVPCPSCMDPKFNIIPSYRREAVVYRHRDGAVFCDHLPTMLCEGGTFGDAFKFLASAHTIYTNSYHGAYWGLLMNRTVIVPDPYSSKFYQMHLDLFIKGKEISYKIYKGDYLEMCRKLNKQFFLKVLEKVYEYMEA